MRSMRSFSSSISTRIKLKKARFEATYGLNFDNGLKKLSEKHEEASTASLRKSYSFALRERLFSNEVGEEGSVHEEKKEKSLKRKV